MYHSSVGKLLMTSGLVCVCVCRATDYTGETRCSLFSCSLGPLPPTSVILRCIHFHGCALIGGTCEVLCTLHQYHDAPVLRILRRAALHHTDTHTHTNTHGAPLWIHCCSAKGFPMIKASLLLVQVLKKLKQKGGGGWRGTW